MGRKKNERERAGLVDPPPSLQIQGDRSTSAPWGTTKEHHLSVDGELGERKPPRRGNNSTPKKEKLGTERKTGNKERDVRAVETPLSLSLSLLAVAAHSLAHSLRLVPSLVRLANTAV